MKVNNNQKDAAIPRVHQVDKMYKGKVKKEKNEAFLNKEEKAEIREYLTKLQTIVPYMPKGKKLSKATVISYAIEYIRELRVTLGLSPSEEAIDLDDDYPLSQIDFQHIHPQVEKTVPINATSPQRHPLCTISSPCNTSASSNGSLCGIQQEETINISNKGITTALPTH